MEKPIRILHILQRMEAGGTQALLMNIYRNIDRSKIQFDFLVEYPNKQFYDEEILNLGGKIYYTNVRNDLNIFKFMKYLKYILQNNPSYSIVHMHTYSIGYFCLKIAKKEGVPIRIAHSHSNSMTKSKKYLKIIMQKLYTIYANHFIAASKEAGEYLFSKKNYTILKNGIDSSKFSHNSEIRNIKRKELLLENSFVVGHVGRFQPEKNHIFLIDIFEQIKKYKGNAKLLLIGNSDPSYEIYDYIIKRKLESDVVILKNINDINLYYQVMDVFVFPSLYEGLGIAGIEAQAAGIPVLCSEKIPIEANISPLFNSINLNEGAEIWAKEALKISESKYAHSNMQEYVINSGFEIKDIAKKMEKFYLEL